MIEKLHYITQSLNGKSHSEMAEVACQSGIRWVQLRMKDVSFNHYLDEAKKTRNICRKYGAKLIINDQVEIAQNVNADGVHLGKMDMTPAEARMFLGSKYIIGGTANTLEDVLNLHQQGVDYVGLGPFRFTTTKKNLSPVLGLEGYRSIIRSLLKNDIEIPVIAIGGILTKDIKEILKTGIHGVAIASLINRSENITNAIQKIIKELEYGEIAHS